MSTVVKSIPKSTREKKYDYEGILDLKTGESHGRIHRLVQGEDFKVDRESVRGAFYNFKTEFNKSNPANKIGLTVQFRTEGDEQVVYLQRVPFSERKSKAPAKPKSTAKAPAKKSAPKSTGRKAVAPSPAQRAATTDAS